MISHRALPIDGPSAALHAEVVGALAGDMNSGCRFRQRQRLLLVFQEYERFTDRLTRHVREKAQQSLGAGGNRGKLDVVDGLRQFTDWATIPLAEKDESLSNERREALVDAPGLNGVVIANGLAHALGVC